MARTHHPRPGVQERILLHLRDYVDFIGSVEVPFALSQMGIANAVAIARSNVPRAISGLKEQSLLTERQAHVSGVSRKRKSYFLTSAGVEIAEETWLRLQDYTLELVQSNGETVEVTLGTIGEYLDFNLRPVDALRYMDDTGILDASLLSPELIERDLSKRVEKQLVSSFGDLPRLRHFYGRGAELDTLTELLEPGPATLLIPGIAGIGKTSLAAKLLERFLHRRNLLYHRCQDGGGVRSFLEDTAGWLSSTGDDSLADFLEATPVPKAEDVIDILGESLADIPALLVIDDYHKVSDEVLHKLILGLTLKIVEHKNELGIVLFSRSYRPVIPLRDDQGRKVSTIIPLDGLDPLASRDLLSSFEEIEDSEFNHIYGLSRGHPLVLELINRGAPTMEHHQTLEQYVSAEIFEKLSAEEKRLLSILAIYREPVPLEALTVHDLNLDVLDVLVEQGLARQADSENYDVHDLIREFILNGIDVRVATPMHSAAASWYVKRLHTPQDVIEYLHHMLGHADTEIVAEEVVNRGPDLVSGGHLELLGIINNLIDEAGPSEVWGRLWQLRGDLLTLAGDWGGAEASFTVAMDHAHKVKDAELEAFLLSSLADLAWKRGDTEAALEMHRDALKRYIAIGDALRAARTYINMGYIFRRQGKKSNAMEAYSEVEHILATEEEPTLRNSRINLARAYLEMGELERGREHALAADEATQSEGDEALHSRARAVLGRYYALTDDRDLALHHYSAAMDSISSEGEFTSQIELILLLGEVLEDSGRRDEAVERYLEGLALAEANDQPMQVGELLARLGSTTIDRQRRMEYLQRSLTIFREVGAKRRMQEVQMMVHQAIMGN